MSSSSKPSASSSKDAEPQLLNNNTFWKSNNFDDVDITGFEAVIVRSCSYNQESFSLPGGTTNENKDQNMNVDVEIVKSPVQEKEQYNCVNYWRTPFPSSFHDFNYYGSTKQSKSVQNSQKKMSSTSSEMSALDAKLAEQQERLRAKKEAEEKAKEAAQTRTAAVAPTVQKVYSFQKPEIPRLSFIEQLDYEKIQSTSYSPRKEEITEAGTSEIALEPTGGIPYKLHKEMMADLEKRTMEKMDKLLSQRLEKIITERVDAMLAAKMEEIQKQVKGELYHDCERMVKYRIRVHDDRVSDLINKVMLSQTQVAPPQAVPKEMPKMTKSNDETWPPFAGNPFLNGKRKDGDDDGTCCACCMDPHFMRDCPYYPLASMRRALYYKQGRCIRCLAYHRNRDCHKDRTLKLCYSEHCKDVIEHDRAMCSHTFEDYCERQRGINLPQTY